MAGVHANGFEYGILVVWLMDYIRRWLSWLVLELVIITLDSSSMMTVRCPWKRMVKRRLSVKVYGH